MSLLATERNGRLLFLASADNEKDADLPIGFQDLRALSCLRMSANKRTGAQSQRRIGLGITDKFPGNGCCFLYISNDLNTVSFRRSEELPTDHGHLRWIETEL